MFANFHRVRTYSHGIKVPFKFPGNLTGKLATCYRQAVPGPAQYVNLPTWWSTHGGGVGSVDILDMMHRCLDTLGTWDGVNSSDLMEDYNKLTNNRHEMAPAAPINTGSSRPSRPVNIFRNASPIFIPGRPSTLKEIGVNGTKFHCFLPCS